MNGNFTGAAGDNIIFGISINGGAPIDKSIGTAATSFFGGGGAISKEITQRLNAGDTIVGVVSNFSDTSSITMQHYDLLVKRYGSNGNGL